MKAAWDDLANEYQGSSSVLIGMSTLFFRLTRSGDVDCTVHQDICSKEGVQGYPTIKYWKDGAVNDYNGGRDFKSLQQFVVDNLQVLCQVSDPKDCSDKEKTFIESMKAKPDQVGAQLARLKGMASTKVAANLKQWISQRINILTQLSSSADKPDL